MRIPVLFFLIIFISCKEKEAVYPFEQSPYVEFEDISFFDEEFGDMLALSFIVWDREGDIGHDKYGIYPYHQFDAVIDKNNLLVGIRNNIEPPFYTVPMNLIYDYQFSRSIYNVYSEYKTFLSEDDSRLDFSCDSYFTIDPEYSPTNSSDTLFGNVNPNLNDIKVTLLKANGEIFDFNKAFNIEQCLANDFSAKMPQLDEVNFFNQVKEGVFEIEKRDRFSYRITYNMRSFAWKSIFFDNQLEIEFQVSDRELNSSNVGSTGLVTLQEITD